MLYTDTFIYSPHRICANRICATHRICATGFGRSEKLHICGGDRNSEKLTTQKSDVKWVDALYIP